jgi:DNA-binding protein H-NS
MVGGFQVFDYLCTITENEAIWRFRVGIENLSVDEIQRQLQELAQNRADLEHALAQRQQQVKHDLAQEVKDLIQEKGYDVSEILSLIGPRRRRSTGAKKGGVRQYTKYVDPDNPKNVYVRGVIPGWMKQKMQDQGYDPASKDDREAFKSQSLRIMED